MPTKPPTNRSDFDTEPGTPPEGPTVPYAPETEDPELVAFLKRIPLRSATLVEEKRITEGDDAARYDAGPHAPAVRQEERPAGANVVLEETGPKRGRATANETTWVAPKRPWRKLRGPSAVLSLGATAVVLCLLFAAFWHAGERERTREPASAAGTSARPPMVSSPLVEPSRPALRVEPRTPGPASAIEGPVRPPVAAPPWPARLKPPASPPSRSLPPEVAPSASASPPPPRTDVARSL